MMTPRLRRLEQATSLPLIVLEIKNKQIIEQELSTFAPKDVKIITIHPCWVIRPSYGLLTFSLNFLPNIKC